MNRTIRLVIFDLDGVIVSTDKHHYMAWKALADEHDLEFDYEINHKLRGVSREESLRIILDENDCDADRQRCFEMTERKNEIYREKLQQLKSADILPGVCDLLYDLKKNDVKVAIGSSSKNARLILQKIGLIDEFDAIVDGNDIKTSKPFPEVFLKCAETLGIHPKSCVVFEDAEAGIDAALAAKMVAIGVGSEHFSHAHEMVESLEGMTLDKLLEIYHKKLGDR